MNSILRDRPSKTDLSLKQVTLVFDRVRDYVELTKPRLVFLVLLSTLVGFFLASRDSISVGLLFSALLGTTLVAAGSMALNEWMEREADAKMARTAKRPLPAGHLEPREALIFGLFLSIFGLAFLVATTNLLSAFIAGLTFAFYLLLYTPLKARTELCTIVGALPGAMPPLIGWAVVTDSIPFEAWILFSIIFFWQMPHFLAIAWIYRKEYAAAGFRMLSSGDETGVRVGRQIVLYSLALLPVSLLPSLAGLTGLVYFFGALCLGTLFVGIGLWSLRDLNQKAPFLFRASLIYLTLLLVLMLADKI